MSPSLLRKLAQRKRRILRRLQSRPSGERDAPMLAAANIHYGLADRTRAIAAGGVGAMHLLARRVGLVRDAALSPEFGKRLLEVEEGLRRGLVMELGVGPDAGREEHRLLDRETRRERARVKRRGSRPEPEGEL